MHRTALVLALVVGIGSMLASCAARPVLRQDPAGDPPVDGLLQDVPLPNERGRSFRLQPSFALGNQDIDVDGGSGDDTGAFRLQIAGEFVGNNLGAGFEVFGQFSEDDLTFNNGRGSTVQNSEVNSLGAFLHFTAMPKAGPHVDLPIRVGPFFEFIRQKETLSTPLEIDIDHVLLGLQVEFMPEVHFDLGSGQEVAGFVGGNVGAATVIVESDLGVGSSSSFFDEESEVETTEAVFYGLETGVRYTAHGFGAQVSYIRRVVDIDDTTFPDLIGNPVLPSHMYTFDGIMFSASMRW